MRLALPAAMLCLWLWAGFLSYFAEANHGNLPGDHSSLCFGDDSLFKKCNCICYDVGNGVCGNGGRSIQCDDVPCEDELDRKLERFTQFPSLNLDSGPNISCLMIENFQFTRLTYSDLSQFPNLVDLQLEHGRLQVIDNNAFNATPQLRFLELDDNQLTSWPPVARLSELHFFEVLDNRIQSLEPGDLSGCYNLTNLNAANNNIRRLRNGVFEDNSLLQTLNLNGNALEVFEEDVFEGLDGLAFLDVQDNRITSLDLLSGRSDLQTLNAANNNIRQLRNGVFEDNCRLKTLNLNGNDIEVIEDDVFEGLHMLESLFLSNALISKLPVKGLSALTTLDLSLARNYKKAFPISDFPLLERVEFFYHAFCCQLAQSQYLVLPPLDFGSIGGEPTERELLCFNTTSHEMVNNSIGMDAQNLTVEQFCMDYCELQPDICGGCANDSGLASSMEPEIVCVQGPIPTPSSCYSSETFSSQITTTVCSTAVASPSPSHTLVDSPSPSHTLVASPSPSHTLLPEAPNSCTAQPIDVVCRNATNSSSPTPSTEPPITDPCDPAYCETLDPSILDPTQCEHCRDFGGPECDATASPPGTCGVLIFLGDLLPGLCECSRKKRSASTLSLKDSRYSRHQRSAASDCIPEGWFLPDLDSTDVICSIVTPSLAPSPAPVPVRTQTCPVAMNIEGYVPGPIISCAPIPDAFNPCEDLLGGSDILRVAIWLVIVMSLVMNMIVIVVTVGYSFILRRAKQDLFIMHFLYLNLAIADFLMGVYLLTLASVDLDTLGNFAATAVKWQTGPGCRFAGFCAITSTVVSVYTLVVITLERAYTIINVMHRRKFSRIMVLVVTLLGWVFGVVMGILPMVGVSDYSRVAVCLPFDVSNRLAKGYVTFLLLATGLAFIVIVASYALIFYEVACSKSKRRLRTGTMKTVWKQELRVGLRMFLLVFTNFVCWFPIALLGLSAAFGETLVSVETSKVIIVFIFPLNACINPILYSVSTTKFRQNFCLLLGRCGLFKDTNSRIISQRRGIPSHTSQTSNQSSHSYLRRLSTRLLSLSSLPPVSNSDDSRRDSRVLSNRRDSNFSQGSFDDHRNLLVARRSSTLSSNSSNEDPGASYRGLRKNSTFSDTSQEEQATSFSNPNYRPSSPTAGRDEKDAKQRLVTKISVSSLGTLPEEIEIAPTPVQEVVKNPGYADVDDEEEGYYTEQKESSDTTPDSNTGSLVHKHGVIDPQYLQHQIMELPIGQTLNSPGGSEDVHTAVIDTSNASSQFETESMKEEIQFD